LEGCEHRKGVRSGINDQGGRTETVFVFRKISWEYVSRELDSDNARLAGVAFTNECERLFNSMFMRQTCIGFVSTARSCVIELALALPAFWRLRSEHVGNTRLIVAYSTAALTSLWIKTDCSLAARISGAQVHDSQLFAPRVEAISAIKDLLGRACKSRQLHAEGANATIAF
jgi:hypothetical protein